VSLDSISGTTGPVTVEVSLDERRGAVTPLQGVWAVDTRFLKFVIAIEFAVRHPSGRIAVGSRRRVPRPRLGDQGRHLEAYRDWAINTGVLHTKLEAYFPGTQIADHWQA
jgi:hypothetical protein